MNERYTAVLLASLSPRQRRVALADVPRARRAGLETLVQQILDLVEGDRAALCAMLDRLRPPDCLSAELAGWLAATPPEWARLLIRSLEATDRRRSLLEPRLAHIQEHAGSSRSEMGPMADAAMAEDSGLPDRLQRMLATIAEREIPLPGPPPIGVLG